MSIDQSSTPRELCILYGRVSDDKQGGLSSQAFSTRHVARLHLLDILAEIEDDGEHGDDLERPGLLEVLAILERQHRAGRPVGWLVVDQSDRLSRADSLDTSELLAKIRRLGVKRVATPSRTYDLFDATDRTLLQIEADHKNNPYLKDLARRALGGMLDAARAGFWVGKTPPLGYRVVKTPGEHGGRKRQSGRLEIDPETAPLVKELFERYLTGESTRDLARWLSARTGRIYSRATVQRLLRAEIYSGTRLFGRRPVGRHARLLDGRPTVMKDGDESRPGDVIRLSAPELAITDPETFARVQRQIDTARTRSQKKNTPITPLSGLTVCGACGARMTSSCQRGYPYVVCSRRKEQGRAACPDTGNMRGDDLLRRVLSLISERLLAGDVVSSLVQLAGADEDAARAAWQRDLAAAEKALAECDSQLTTARRRLASAPEDLVEDYQATIREMKEQRAALEADLARLRTQEPVADGADAELIERWLQQALQLVQPPNGVPLNPAEQNAILREVVAEVRVFPPPEGIKKSREGTGTIGRVEVLLPAWLSRVLARSEGRTLQHAKGIVLVSEG